MVRQRVLKGILVFLSVAILIYNFKWIDDRFKNGTPGKLSITKQRMKDLFCIVLTNEANFKERAQSVYSTWGQQCDKTLLACNCSTVENENNMPILQLNITEDVNKMARKVLLALKLVFKEYESSYRFFLMTDDDTYVFVNNTRKFISRLSEHEPLTYGYNFKISLKNGFHSGGAGILFTHESLRRIVQSISAGLCNITSGFGDLAIGACAEQSNVSMGSSLDSSGRERFHPLNLKSHFMEPVQGWLQTYSLNEPKTGIQCCSDETVSFHYVKPEEMKEISQKLKDETKISDYFFSSK